VEADPRLVGQGGHPLGPEYRRKGAQHAWQTLGRHNRDTLHDHLPPGDLGPMDRHDRHHRHPRVGQDLGGLVSLEVHRAQRAAADALATFRASGFGYFLEQATRPQTIGYALLDSPVALAAWMLDHDTDSYHKISRAFVEGQPSGGLTRDHILDNITLYWLTGTGASAARSYWEGGRARALAADQAPPEVSVPVGFTTFPGELWAAPRSWVEQGYPNLSYFNEVDRGGHFAAWEEPEQFATEIRAAFRTLR
jgi:pimeloyl-ACP methyl ester carboxylesterase